MHGENSESVAGEEKLQCSEMLRQCNQQKKKYRFTSLGVCITHPVDCSKHPLHHPRPHNKTNTTFTNHPKNMKKESSFVQRLARRKLVYNLNKQN